MLRPRFNISVHAGSRASFFGTKCYWCSSLGPESLCWRRQFHSWSVLQMWALSICSEVVSAQHSANKSECACLCLCVCVHACVSDLEGWMCVRDDYLFRISMWSCGPGEIHLNNLHYNFGSQWMHCNSLTITCSCILYILSCLNPMDYKKHYVYLKCGGVDI